MKSLNKLDWDSPRPAEELNLRVKEAKRYLDDFVEASMLNEENQPRFTIGTMSFYLAMTLELIERNGKNES